MRLSHDEMIFYQNSFKIKASERTLRLKMMVEARGVEPLTYLYQIKDFKMSCLTSRF